MNSVHPQRRAGEIGSGPSPAPSIRTKAANSRNPAIPSAARASAVPGDPFSRVGAAARAPRRFPNARTAWNSASTIRIAAPTTASREITPRSDRDRHHSWPANSSPAVSRRAVVLISTPHENRDVDGPRDRPPRAGGVRRRATGAGPRSRGRHACRAAPPPPGRQARRARDRARRRPPPARPAAGRGRRRRPAQARPRARHVQDLGKWKCDGKASRA